MSRKRRDTLAEALGMDDDMLLKMRYPEQQAEFCMELDSKREEIESLVSYHLGLDRRACEVGSVEDWISGGFNVCIPVNVRTGLGSGYSSGFLCHIRWGNHSFPEIRTRSYAVKLLLSSGSRSIALL